MTEKRETETATYEVTGQVGGVPVVLTEDEAAGFVFAGWVGGEHEANRKTGRLKIQEAYDDTARVGDKHPQDRWYMQHAAWEQVWEAARACEDFREFKEAMEELTLCLRWTKTRGDQQDG
jgi:Zn-dependent M32 family carboxypeptidase